MPENHAFAALEERGCDHLDELVAAAVWTAEQLLTKGFARVTFGPGDATEYTFVIAAPGVGWYYDHARETKEAMVCLATTFGCSYPWDGNWIDASYGTKWAQEYGTGTSRHTGTVVAAFLNAVSENMNTIDPDITELLVQRAEED